jgi:hypothetical protein
MGTPRLFLPLALALFLGLSGTAMAQADRTGTVSAGTPSFKWKGQIGVGVTMFTTFHDVYPCNMPAHTCDFTLVRVADPGKVAIKTSSTNPLMADLDLWVYNSDEKGTKGRLKGESAQPTPTPEEQFSFTAEEPGWYLVEADYAITVGGDYDGEVTLQPGVGLEDTNVAPTVRITTPKKSVKSSSFKSIAGSATDDGSVSRVDIAVVTGKGSNCRAMTSSGSFSKSSCTAPRFLRASGAARWSYRLKKKLKKGSYVVFAKATDDADGTTTARLPVKVS